MLYCCRSTCWSHNIPSHCLNGNDTAPQQYAGTAAFCRRRITRQVQELQQFIVTRPEKTNNTYWPLEEKLLVGACQPLVATWPKFKAMCCLSQ